MVKEGTLVYWSGQNQGLYQKHSEDLKIHLAFKLGTSNLKLPLL